MVKGGSGGSPIECSGSWSAPQRKRELFLLVFPGLGGGWDGPSKKSHRRAAFACPWKNSNGRGKIARTGGGKTGSPVKNHSTWGSPPFGGGTNSPTKFGRRTKCGVGCKGGTGTERSLLPGSRIKTTPEVVTNSVQKSRGPKHTGKFVIATGRRNESGPRQRSPLKPGKQHHPAPKRYFPPNWLPEGPNEGAQVLKRDSKKR